MTYDEFRALAVKAGLARFWLDGDKMPRTDMFIVGADFLNRLHAALPACQTTSSNAGTRMDASFVPLVEQAPSAPVDVCAQMRAMCSACGGTGDVTSIDGEWRGSCDCQGSAPVAPDERVAFEAAFPHLDFDIIIDPEGDEMYRDDLSQGAFIGWQARATLYAQAGDADPIRKLIALHADELDQNEYAYFELARTRRTDWMAWICSNLVDLDPSRKVLATGQGSTPDEACANAALDYAKRAAAPTPPQTGEA